MEAALKNEILRKCRRNFQEQGYSSAEEEKECGGTENEEEVFNNLEEAKNASEEKLPFQDILAEKHRKYSAKEEFIFLLYNDILPYFVTKWDGKYLRKKWEKKFNEDNERSSEKDEENEDFGMTESDTKADEALNETRDNENVIWKEDNTNSSPTWKLKFPDEHADITFINKNTYSGRISRKMMEGEGVYKWNNGVQYKGMFQNNCIQGKGILEWNNDCWYEGEFKNGYRHGRGIMIDKENHCMYTGQWYMGYKHGKGYCRYGDNGSYDGDWVMDKMNGTGLRIYPSGARYTGQWRNGMRHGTGTMAWVTGDIYRGEWRCGEMNGCGEYVWNGFFNKTLTWPQEVSYVGNWCRGMRHGKGVLKLKSIGGAKFVGHWKENKKHGYGMIIGNNGEKLESDPLFLDDILVPSDANKSVLEVQVKTEDRGECVRNMKEAIPLFSEKRAELMEAPILPISKPEQTPLLSYYITRLLTPKSVETPVLRSLPSGKCNICEDNKSCSCLLEDFKGTTLIKDQKSMASVTSLNQGSMNENIISPNHYGSNVFAESEYEKRWTYNCLMTHMPRLRQVYNDYAKLFAPEAPTCNLVMSRLCLWQLWRDCGIHRKKLSLSDIDNHIAKNTSTLVEDMYHPFEKIEIWQFLHALLEVSWHLYTKHDDVKVEDMNGKLACGLHKLLITDIYPNVGNHVGSVWQEYRDLLPINCVFELYRQTGYPVSAKNLLRATCTLKDTSASLRTPRCPSTITIPAPLLNGINSSTVGNKISYLPKCEGILMKPQNCDNSQDCKDDLAHDLLAFRHLGATRMVEIMAKTCPSIKDTDTGAITNMDYELTFLEFYEIILEASKQLLSSKKQIKRNTQMTKTELKTTLLKSGFEEPPTPLVRSSIDKGSKTKKKRAP